MSATYGRNKKFGGQEENQKQSPQPAAESSEEKSVHFDGYQQVLDMLRAADPEFRKSLLMRLSNRDPRLGKELRKDLGF